MRTAEGEILSLTVGTLDVASGGLPAPHLREHLVSGDPIQVWYLDDSGTLIALRYVDAH